MAEKRPNPDELLHKITEKQSKLKKGRLKIFFGACAGVGKTFAMLTEARALHMQNIDVVVGFIETHGRIETAELLTGLEILSTKKIEYHGRILQEFDLDAALARKPAVILIDELAHTNAIGCRHTKRWQDVEELLNAGMDVYTTVNVQHLEGISDIVAHITGIKISETFPDRLFNNADEVKLVDLPPDEVITRLQQGKVYVPEQIQFAVKNFFRKGNLIALRELALRRMADRVDIQMREYREDQAIKRIWQVKDRLLVCVGPETSSKNIIRKAFRIATNLRADWFAVYIETPKLQRLSKNKRDQILKNLKFAQELGAETSLLAGGNLAEILVQFVRTHNINKIIVGKPNRSKLSRFFLPSLPDILTAQSLDMDVFVVERTPETVLDDKESTVSGFKFEAPSKTYWPGYFWGLFTCILVTVLGIGLFDYLSLSDIAMLYLLGVAVIATRFGRGPGMISSCVSLGLFDFCFVPPRWSFLIATSQYLITFAVLLAVAMIISNLSANLRYQLKIAIHRERRTSQVNQLSKELTTALTIPQVIEIGIRHLQRVFKAKVWLLLPDDKHRLQLMAFAEHTAQIPIDLTIAQWVFENGQSAGAGTQTLAVNPLLYLPLRAPISVRGVLAILPSHLQQLSLPEQQRLLDTFCAQVALSLEHLHYITVARDGLLAMESERLRDAVLSSISRALYPPLTKVLKMTNSLLNNSELSSSKELLQSIHTRTMRMHSLVSNLLDITRLQLGDIELNKQWCDLHKIVKKALQASQLFLVHHRVVLQIPADFPLIHFDPVLMKRVFYHLLENASEYTPPGSVVQISAEKQNQTVLIYIEDNGPGLPIGMEEKIFEKFIRGEEGHDIPGVGLGLAICRAILQAHGCEIAAENKPKGGARFIIRIPLKKEES